MADKVRVEVVAVDHEVWSGEADMVVAKTTEGDIGVLHGHTPLLGALAEGGVVRVIGADGEGSELRAAVHGGFLSVTDDGVQILAEVAELADDIDVDRARRALDRVQGDAGDDEEAAAAARRARARLTAAGQDA